jgi:RNA polymerase sigma factor (sigma-70 family)
MVTTSIQHGEVAAVSVIEQVELSFRDHAEAIRGKALQMTRDPEVASDVTQEAFLRLFVEAEAGRMPDNARAWLYRTSANLIVSRARHGAVAQRMAPRLVHYDEPAQPEAVVVRRETRIEVRGVLATLPPRDREALLMAANGATGLEIAGRLGLSHTAGRALLHRARRRFKAATFGLEAVAGAAAGSAAASGLTAVARPPFSISGA